MTPGSANSTFLSVILAAIVAVSLAGCGGNVDGVKESDARNNTKGDVKRHINQGLGGRSREDGSLFGPGGLFGA